MVRVMTAERRAAGLLIFRFLEEYQYLLLQTSYGRHHWTPPKGHVDPGEDEMQAALRETREEAGLSDCHYDIVSSFPPIILKYQVGQTPKSVYYWLAKLKDPNTPIKLSDEHQAFKWITVKEADEAGFKDLAEAIRKADTYLREHAYN